MLGEPFLRGAQILPPGNHGQRARVRVRDADKDKTKPWD